MARRWTLAALLVLAAVNGGAHADDSACAKFEDPLAYNACLASHGPKAGALRATRDGEGPAGAVARMEPRVAAGRSAQAERHSAAPTVERRRGRAHMEFHIQ